MIRFVGIFICLCMLVYHGYIWLSAFNAEKKGEGYVKRDFYAIAAHIEMGSSAILTFFTLFQMIVLVLGFFIQLHIYPSLIVIITGLLGISLSHGLVYRFVYNEHFCDFFGYDMPSSKLITISIIHNLIWLCICICTI